MDRHLSKTILFITLAALIPPTHAASVTESARQIPIAYNVDVVVVGGSSGAVSAAVAAANAGAKVFLLAPRPYLGEDLCATLRLWLEEGETPTSELARKLFSDPGGAAAQPYPKGLPFKYEASLPPAAMHKDTTPPSRLADGVLGPPESQSVQYDGDVTITADLGSSRSVQEARVVLFHRAGDFDPQSVTLHTSDDRQEWKEIGTLKCDNPDGGSIIVSAPIGSALRYARFQIKRRPDTNRILVGEITLVGNEPAPATRPAEPQLARRPVRPMHVKKTLDDALLAAKVQYLYSCYATDVLRDADGKLCGVVMANRAGRQAVLANAIIDATDRASVARMAGATFTPYPTGPQTFQWTVIGGEPQSKPGLTARKVGVGYGDNASVLNGFEGYPIIEYTLQIPIPDSGFPSFARAEQIARDLTWSEDWEANTEEPFQIPPDAIQGTAGADGAFRPAGTERLYVLGGCADLPRDQAARLLRPVALIDAGARIGATAAAEAKSTPAVKGAQVSAAKPSSSLLGDIKESLSSVRPTQRQLPTVPSPERALPVLGEYDVVVVGGGTGGAPAGISAARAGAKTLVLEYLHGLGGVGTQGLITKYYWGYRGGFTAEVPGGASWNPIDKAEWYRRTLREAGGEVWFGVLGCGAYVENGVVKGAVIATPQGRGVVLAKVVIDSTGSSDIASAAGAQTMNTGADEIALQGTGLPAVKLSPSYTNTDFTIVDETDMLDVWHLFVYAKNKYAAAFDLGQLIDTRERRRIVGEFTMTLPDQINNRTYPDTIALAYSNFDTHGYTVDPYLLVEHPEKVGITVNIPYRCLLPKGLEGILVTGLGISVHRDAVPLTRMQPDIQNQGYSAGLIAATAARTGVALRSVDLRPIQQQLIKKEIVPARVLTDRDSYPLSAEKIAQAVVTAKDGKGLAVVLTHAPQSLPLLKNAYASAASDADKLAYARVLAVMGDPAGLDTLIKALDAATWDKGWNYTGMGQFGSSLSPVDTLIVSIGYARDRRAVTPILRKVAQLDANSEFSHHRAVALALDTIADPSAAGGLAELLAKPAMCGYVHANVDTARQLSGQNPNDNTTRSTSIRELSLARALFHCGDQNGLARQILTEYTQDLRGHLARHAQAVLDEKK
jgi:flavin-dependent dehydrogenase